MGYCKTTSVKHLPRINGLQKIEKLNKRPGVYSNWYRNFKTFLGPKSDNCYICIFKKVQTKKIQYLHCFWTFLGSH